MKGERGRTTCYSFGMISEVLEVVVVVEFSPPDSSFGYNVVWSYLAHLQRDASLRVVTLTIRKCKDNTNVNAKANGFSQAPRVSAIRMMSRKIAEPYWNSDRGETETVAPMRVGAHSAY